MYMVMYSLHIIDVKIHDVHWRILKLLIFFLEREDEIFQWETNCSFREVLMHGTLTSLKL